MIIRNETKKDIEAITAITIAAFKNLQVSHQTEQFIIHELRKSNVLTLSLVAEVDGGVVGHISFSPIKISDGSENWYGLGPISVKPDLQKQGIGKSLVNEGLSILKAQNGEGCALVGDPGYYRQFGFENIPGLIHEGVPQEVFLVLPFDNSIPQGTVEFHESFLATG